MGKHSDTCEDAGRLSCANRHVLKRSNKGRESRARGSSASMSAQSLPLVSILIPCHNTEQWVGRAIESGAGADLAQ